MIRDLHLPRGDLGSQQISVPVRIIYRDRPRKIRTTLFRWVIVKSVFDGCRLDLHRVHTQGNHDCRYEEVDKRLHKFAFG